MGKNNYAPHFGLLPFLGHRRYELDHKCGRHMQLFWCSSKIYCSNILQVEELVVC